MRKLGHSALRIKDGQIQTFDPHPASTAAALLGSLRTAKKSAAGRRNISKANEARKEQDAGRSWKERKIIRIERAPGKTSYFEVLSCGHRGHLAEGPNRHYLPSLHPNLPSKRRCYECCAEKEIK